MSSSFISTPTSTLTVPSSSLLAIFSASLIIFLKLRYQFKQGLFGFLLWKIEKIIIQLPCFFGHPYLLFMTTFCSFKGQFFSLHAGLVSSHFTKSDLVFKKIKNN